MFTHYQQYYGKNSFRTEYTLYAKLGKARGIGAPQKTWRKPPRLRKLQLKYANTILQNTNRSYNFFEAVLHFYGHIKLILANLVVATTENAAVLRSAFIVCLCGCLYIRCN